MFLLLLLLSYGDNEIKRDYDLKKLQTQYSIIINHNMNEHTMYSGLPSDPCEEVLKLKHPFTYIVGGLSSSENSSFVIKLKTTLTSC